MNTSLEIFWNVEWRVEINYNYKVVIDCTTFWWLNIAKKKCANFACLMKLPYNILPRNSNMLTIYLYCSISICIEFKEIISEYYHWALQSHLKAETSSNSCRPMFLIISLFPFYKLDKLFMWFYVKYTINIWKPPIISTTIIQIS